MYDFYSEYDIYQFTEDNDTLIARSYTDTKSEVYFLQIKRSGTPMLFNETNIDSSMFTKAIEHLKSEGK